MTETTQLSRIRLDESEAVQNTRLDVSSPRLVRDGSTFHSKEDEISVGRWKLGFFIFYGVAALLLVGLAATTDRLATFASTAAPANSVLVNR